jgi:hypothetical protein
MSGGDADGEFCVPNIFVTLWFELDYGPNPSLGTLMI